MWSNRCSWGDGVTIDPLVGAWRLLSAYAEIADTGRRQDLLGPDPRGSILFSADGRMAAVLTAGGRKPPRQAADYEEAFATLVAYAGTVRVIGAGRLVVAVDTAWQPDWVGSEQLRYFRIDGDTLTLRSDQTRLPRFGDRLLTIVVIWRRGEPAVT